MRSMRGTTSTIRPGRCRALRQHQFGVNLGGPLRRDRTFFFFSYEGQRIGKAQTQTFSVPTAAVARRRFFRLARRICDPLTRTAAAPARLCRQSDSGAAAGSGRRALLAKVPLPTSPGLVQNLLGGGRQVNPMNQFSLRVDHRLGASDHPVRPV